MKTFVPSASLLMLALAVPAAADEIAPYDWTGGHFGAHVGAGMNLTTLADPFGPSIFGDTVHSPGVLAGVQLGFDQRIAGTPWVVGLETDASFANFDGTNTCYAHSGTFSSFDCRVHTDAFGTVTGRAGLAFGPAGRSLVYVKGGLAWGHSDVELVLNHDLAGLHGGSRSSVTTLGWTLGTGVEVAVAPQWTVRAEYGYLDLGRADVAAPAQSVVTQPTPIPGPFVHEVVAVPGTDAARQIHAFKLGVNYQLGRDGPAFAAGDGWYPAFMPRTAAPPPWSSDWSFQGGGRYWYSSGRFQKDIAPGNVGAQNPTVNISRLTWDDLPGHSGEGFGRIDTPWAVFVKGFVGAGGIPWGGKINDEDWGLDDTRAHTGYSNTEGNATGKLSYATVDAGFDVLRGQASRLGVFIGYNVYKEDKSSFTCTQLALPASGICEHTHHGFILGEDDTWKSMRLGATAELMLIPGLKLVADVAVLPVVDFKGQDAHPLRPFVAEEWGRGRGAQAELILSYAVTPQLDLGVGGRYWAMWTLHGADCRLPPEGNCPAAMQDMQFKTERFGALFQASWRWDDAEAAALRP